MPNTRAEWDAYVAGEKAALMPILAELGYAVDEVQPHISGERFLFQAVTTTSGRKLILLGRAKDGSRVVIKATRDGSGAQELMHERMCRETLENIDFAYELFTAPRELLFTTRGGFTISAQAFIEQEKAFLDRTLKEQFAYALGAFKAQEGAHATTYEHRKYIRSTFGSMDAADYLARFAEFQEETGSSALMESAAAYLRARRGVIEQYGNFLTHTDFVPHNIRIKDGQIYLLDYSSLRFGNKYEGWARFLNFMALHNPPLADALIEYVRLNRTSEELESLAAMRAYRLGEMVTYHSRNVSRAEGDLQKLTQARVEFWQDMLAALLAGNDLPLARIEAYRSLRDALRSDEEKARQVGLH